MANQWFKFYGAEYLSDPKMDRLTVQERSCWLTLLCMASQTDGIIKYISIDGLLNKSGIRFDPYDTTEWDNAQNVLKTLENYKMIHFKKNNGVTSECYITNWNKRQDHYLTGAERVAKSRANKKHVTMNVTDVTLEENRIEENRIDKIKNIYGEFKNVLLKEEEYKKLIEKLSEVTTKNLIEQLSGYIASTGKRYSSHYATILGWNRRKIEQTTSKVYKNTNSNNLIEKLQAKTLK